MKNQNGITLTVLVTTIILLSILTGTITYSSISSFKLKKYYELQSDIELLDDKISLYYLENEYLPIFDEYIDIEELINNYNSSDVNYNPNNLGKLYKIDVSKLDNINLENDKYYVDLQSHTVYSKIPVKLDNVYYYTISYNYQKIF